MSDLQIGTEFILDTRVFPRKDFAFYPTRHVTGVIELINENTDNYKYVVRLKGVEREERTYLLQRSEILLMPKKDYTLTDIINIYPNPLAVLEMYNVKTIKGSVDNTTTILQARYQQGVDYSYRFVRQCQGTILDKDLNIIVSGFEKFFNRNEPNAPVLDPNELYMARPKVDGFQIRVSKYPNGDLVIGSRQTDRLDIKLENDCTLKDIVESASNYKRVLDICQDVDIDTQITHLFEVLSPDNKIVIPYEQTYLTYLGSSCVDEYGNFEIYYLNVFEEFGMDYFVTTPTTLEDACATDTDTEGWVMNINSYEFVKFKTDWYFEKHWLYTKQIPSTKKIVKCIKQGTIDDLRQLLTSNGYSTDCITDVEIIIFSTLTRHINYAESFMHQNVGLSRKEYAIKAFKELDEYTASLALKALTQELSIADEIDTLFEGKLVEMVKNEQRGK